MNKSAELVFIPTPGMTHLVATLELAKLILQRSECITVSVYIFHLADQVAKVNAYIDSQSRDNPYPTRLTFVTYPPLATLKGPAMPKTFHVVVEHHKPLVKQAIQERVRAGSAKPAGFVLNMFCTAMVDIANELNVPCYLFFTTGISFLNLIFYAQSLSDDHGVDYATKFSDPACPSLVPGFKNPVPSNVIPGSLQIKEASGEMMIVNTARKFKEMKAILVNTYVELESFAIQASLNSKDQNIPPLYHVGPILDLGSESHDLSENTGKGSITEWLDGQPKSSVVFLCFGSMGFFDEKQVKEIANGLERSGHRFLWALRNPRNSGVNEPFLEALPEGFINRTSSRGKIIAWAPQVKVLAHPAIGGFVSHCGWNSTLESLLFGVPMAAWPMYAEQHLNAFKLVKESELAVEITMDYKSNWNGKRGYSFVTAEEIEKGVENLMSMDEKTRGRAKKMGDEGRKALEEGGSSYIYLGQFIEEVLSNVA